MKKQTTITIGIPAFNEEANIANLLHDILKQTEHRYEINSIVVLSDGSKDKTDEIVKAFKNKKITVLNDQKRLGKAARLNLFFKTAKNDIAIIFDADTRIYDPLYIHKLIVPIMKEQAHLTSSDIKQVKPSTFIERIIFASMEFKKKLYKDINEGNNIYTCYGYARAFSKKLYKQIQIPDSVGEDAYSYLFVVSKKLGFKAVNNTAIFYKLPSTFGDHSKQSVRFFHSQTRFIQEFGKEFVMNEYHISKSLAFKSIFKTLFTSPYFVFYLLILIDMKLKSIVAPQTKSTWAMAKTSKKGVV